MGDHDLKFVYLPVITLWATSFDFLCRDAMRKWEKYPMQGATQNLIQRSSGASFNYLKMFDYLRFFFYRELHRQKPAPTVHYQR